ncbi:MAG: hypothetical protein V4812_21395 [Pseudomonadota bacterium]
MPLYRLIGFLAPLALVLPLTAQAAWPEGARDAYIKECVAAANIDAQQAQKQCACTAEVISKEFTEAEIQSLNNQQNAIPAPLQDRLVKAVGTCNT